ncbi:unnamed protein product [Rangifer tarandus platyrhynchus]|uniref:Uncharacterized protein n=1 Tax=Rangifer tarandus platyrhynchus TaxID=3082113 RepID=A0ABN9A5J3_RANTA|nr:unnamed protein product [Rangifer tarandus platyrhynchus]
MGKALQDLQTHVQSEGGRGGLDVDDGNGVWAGERMPEGERGEAPGDPFHQVLIAVRALCGPGLTAHPEDISGLATETASCGKEGRT